MRQRRSSSHGNNCSQDAGEYDTGPLSSKVRVFTGCHEKVPLPKPLIAWHLPSLCKSSSLLKSVLFHLVYFFHSGQQVVTKMTCCKRYRQCVQRWLHFQSLVGRTSFGFGWPHCGMGQWTWKNFPLVNGGMIHHIFYIKLLIIIPFPNIPPIPIHAHQKEKPHAQSPCSGLPSCMIFGIGVLSNLAAKNCANC